MNCDCLERSNEALQRDFPGVYLKHFTNIETGKASSIVVATERLTGRGRVPLIKANFCPFCGVGYKDNDTRAIAILQTITKTYRETLEQIAVIPRNARARRLARAVLDFISNQPAAQKVEQ